MQQKLMIKGTVVMLAFFLALGPAGSVLAVDSFQFEQQAQELHNLGLYNGIDPSGFQPDLGSSLDRQTGVIMLLRLFGLEPSVEQLNDHEVNSILAKFPDDSEIAPWARRQVAYAVQNNLVNGLPDGRFGPGDVLNGRAYSTLILRQLGYSPYYQTAPLDLAGLGVLTPPQMQQFADKQLIKDDLVGISYGTLTQLISGPGQQPTTQKVSIDCPSEQLAVKGRTETLEFTVTPFDAEIKVSSGLEGIVVPQALKKMDNGRWVYEFAAIKEGSDKIEISGWKNGYRQASQYVLIKVVDPITINGLDSPPQVGLGTGSLPFGVSPGQAAVSVSAFSSGTLENVRVSGTGNARSLEFTAVKAGEAYITITASQAGYQDASKTVKFTITGSPVFKGLEDEIEVNTGYQSLSFALEPADAEAFLVDWDSDIIRDVDLRPTSRGYELDFWAGSPGIVNINLVARKVGYYDQYKQIQVEVLAPAFSEGDSSPPAITLGGLESTLVSGGTIQYIPFTVDQADVTWSVNVADPTVVSNASIIMANSATGVRPLLKIEAVGGSGTSTTVTITASKPGYSSATRQVDIGIHNGLDINIAGLAANKSVTAATADDLFTCGAPGDPVEVFWKNSSVSGTPTLMSLTDTGAAQNWSISFPSVIPCTFEMIITVRGEDPSGNQFDSRLVEREYS